ncbi:MAG TPA: Hsp70 family protein [Streptomyces sp.]
MARLGIDLGTWSVAALLVDDVGRRLVPDPVTGQFWSRAAVALAPDGSWLYGRSAEELRATHPDRYRDDLKRLLDSDRPIYLGGMPYRPERLLALLVERALRQARTLTSEPIDELLVGIPVTFETVRQQTIRKAVGLAGFDGPVALVPEPVAAARIALGEGNEPGTWLVFDLGGGTLDLALVRIEQGGELSVLDTAGDPTLGGFAIDDAVVEHLRRTYELAEADELDPADLSDLVAAARSLKHQLSDAATAYARNPLGGRPRQFTLALEQLRALAMPVVDAACARCEALLAANGLWWPDLAGIVPTGGASRSPAVWDRLKARGTLVTCSQPPELATAHGLLPPDPEPEPEPEVPPSARTPTPTEPLSAWAGTRGVPITASTAWSLESVATLKGHTAEVVGVSFSPDGCLIATASWDETVRVWDGRTGALRHTLHGHNDYVNAVSFAPDGRTLASGSDKKKVRIWDAVNGTQRFVLAGHDDVVNTVAFSTDGILATGSDDKTINLWGGHTGEHLGLIGPLDNAVKSVTFSPDGRLLLAGAGPSVFVWDLGGGGLLEEHDGHWDTVRAVAFSPDGRTYASADDDGEVRVWDAQGHWELEVLSHSKCINALAYSPSGDLLATGSEDSSKIRLWRTSDFSLVKKLEEYDDVNALAFSPDGAMLATGIDTKTVEIWRVG